jgi:hypothetical protein
MLVKLPDGQIIDMELVISVEKSNSSTYGYTVEVCMKGNKTVSAYFESEELQAQYLKKVGEILGV